MAFVKKKKKISRRKPGKKSNMYFHEGTAAAISAYQQTDDLEEKQKLYVAEIFPAFSKLVENLIFIHGFRGLHDSYEDLKSDCVAFLYEAIGKFDPSRGSKPFSYFNVVAKNWLIIRSKQRVKNIKRNVSIDDRECLGRRDAETIENYHIVPAQDDQMMTWEFLTNIHTMLHEIKGRVVNENEIKCMNAIIHIFEVVSDNDDRPGDSDLMLNKRAVFSYIRDISGLTPKQLTTTIASIKKHYRELKYNEDFGIF